MQNRIIAAIITFFLISAVVSCDKEESQQKPSPTPTTKVECALSLEDGALTSSGALEKEPGASILVTKGEDVDYTVCYNIDDGNMVRLTGIRMDIARRLDLSGHMSAGSHILSGYVYHELDSCRFSGTYKVTVAAPTGKVECSLKTANGSLTVNGEVEKEPVATLSVSGGENADYTVRYSVDNDTLVSLTGIRPDTLCRLDVSGYTRKGSHLVSGYVYRSTDTCRFSGSYEMTAPTQPQPQPQPDTVIYEIPVVVLTVKDTIPASGGTVSSGTVTYSQKHTVITAGTRKDTVLTTGGEVSFKNSVTASSRGKQQGGLRTVDSLRVSVTMNGMTGYAAAPVYQAPNNRKAEYGNPVVSLQVSDDIPAKGGSISEGTVTYSQTATYSYDSGEQEQAVLTTGGEVRYGNPVTASSLGVTLTQRKQVGTLTVTVTLNGHSGEASAQVWQQANKEEKLVLSPETCTLVIGGRQTISARMEYTSGDKESTDVNLVTGAGLSLNGKTITATSCSQSGTESQVTGSKGNLTATVKVKINPRYENMRYDGPTVMYLGQEYTYSITCRCVCQTGSTGTLLDLTDSAQAICEKKNIVGVGVGHIHPISAGTETVTFKHNDTGLSLTFSMTVYKP